MQCAGYLKSWNMRAHYTCLLVLFHKANCSLIAVLPGDQFKSLYVAGSKWPDPNLSYRITQYTSDISKSQVNADVRKALNMWAEVSGLTFNEIDEGLADITVLFAAGEHGDDVAFDGPGKILAHAWFARNFLNDVEGDAHFDDDETWSSGSYSGKIHLLYEDLGRISYLFPLRSDVLRNCLRFTWYFDNIVETDYVGCITKISIQYKFACVNKINLFV